MLPNQTGQVPTSQNYDYSQSGIDNFLSRAIDTVSWQTTLDAMLNFPGSETLTTLPTPPASNNLNMDSAQVTGSVAQTMAVGDVNINGSAGNIILSDGSNDRVLIGNNTSGA